MPAYFKVQAALADQTNLARDQYINGFHLYYPTPAWSDDAARTIVLQAAANALEAFYKSWKGYMAPNISPNLGSVKFYDQALPLESPPVAVFPMELTGTGDAPGHTGPNPISAYPNEVACCITMHGQPQGGAVQRQSWRGRIYCGPLNITAGAASTFGHSRPTAAFLSDLKVAALNLHAALVTVDAEWVIASKVQQMLYPIMNFAVDNSWDTIRSRGDKPTTADRGDTTTHVDAGTGAPIAHAVR